MLAWTIYISFLGAAALMFLPAGNPRTARRAALLAALAGLACAAAGAMVCRHHAAAGVLTDAANAPWIAELGIRYHLAADGISLTLVLLTGIAAVAGVLFSWNVENRSREFFALYLALIGAVYVTFGYEAVRPAVVEVFDEHIDFAESSYIDHKTELQEHLARSARSVSYRVLGYSGPPHEREFEIEACVDGEALGHGFGTSKKRAEQEAAAEALNELQTRARRTSRRARLRGRRSRRAPEDGAPEDGAPDGSPEGAEAGPPEPADAGTQLAEGG